MSKIYNDKNQSFTVPLTLVNKKEISKDSKIFYIKKKKAVVDKKEGKEYYLAQTKNCKTVYYQMYDKRPSFYKVKGYIKKDNSTTIAFCSFKILFIFFIMIGFALIGSIFLFDHKDMLNKIPINNNSNINTEEQSTIPQGDGVSDLDDLLHSNESLKTLSVPQFSDLFITKGVYVPLMNLPQNEILLMYEVYTTDNKLVFSSKEPLLPNSEDKWYLDDHSKGSYNFIIKAYKVTVKGDKIIKGNSITFNTTIHIY